MIDVYWGEFLTCPVPLESSIGRCSHGCVFCFERLKPRKSAGSSAEVIKELARPGKTLRGHLIRERYPVCISNRTDPFCKACYQDSVALMRAMVGMGMPIYIQTRGGEGWKEVLSFLPPSVWYVSISSLNAELTKKLEPGAPSPQERLAMINEVANKGHNVIIGYNPAVEEWEPDPPKLISAVKNAGAKGAWVEQLHFNYQHLENMSGRDRELLGEQLIEDAQKKHSPRMQYFEGVRAEVIKQGLSLFSMGQANKSNIWDLFSVYKSCFPTTQGFVNTCEEETLYSFEQYMETMKFPEGNWQLHHYLASTGRQVWQAGMQTSMDFRELLRIIWTDIRCRANPVRNHGFAYATSEGDGEQYQLTDADGLPLVLYSSVGFDGVFAEVKWPQAEDIGAR